MNPHDSRHESRDDYLEAILRVTEEKGTCRSVDIARQLNVSKPSVSVALNKLEAEGYAVLDADKLVRLTETGLAIAAETLARHNWFKNFLISAGVEPDTAETEACAMEHMISADTFEKLMRKYSDA